jgi:hypothetical protein
VRLLAVGTSQRGVPIEALWFARPPATDAAGNTPADSSSSDSGHAVSNTTSCGCGWFARNRHVRRTVPSLPQETKRVDSALACSGSHATKLIHFLCAVGIVRSGSVCEGDHIASMPSLLPDTRKRPHGDHAMHSTGELQA